MKNKNITIFLICTVILFIIFFIINYKIKNNGNNINKINSLEDVFSFNSYEADVEVTVQSNKTTNKYKIKQMYYKPNIVKQVIIEPLNLENVVIIYDGNNLKVENTNLGLSKIYNEYKYINNNVLWLNSFVEYYNDDSKVLENENEMIIENNNVFNKYIVKQVLYINKKNNKPTKMEILDNNQNVKIYIKYNEIKFNSLDKTEIIK